VPQDSRAGRHHFIERLLNLRRGDLVRGLPLFIYHFLIISCLVVGQVVRDTLFLDRFQASQLPYVDMAIAAIMLLVVAGYTYSRRFASLRALQTGSLLAFAGIAGLFWWTTWTYHWTWLYPALYIWVGIFGVLAPTQMWILIVHLLSTRDRRLLGMVASGGIAGGIGGFLSTAIVQRLEAEHLLLVMMLLLLACSAMVAHIWRQWQSTLAEMEVSAPADSPDRTWNLPESIRQMRASAHLKAIAALVCMSSIVTNIAGWQFKAMAALSFLEKNDLAAFFGAFYGYVSILGFLVAQILAPRLLVLSLSIALMMLPIVLVAGTFGFLASGALWATTFLKGSDKILRYAIEKPAVESLYFPVPSHIMMQVKMFIDTVSWRLGDGLAGVIVFIFATLLQLSARQISWVNLILLVGWLMVVYLARRQYVATLADSLQQHRLDAEQTAAQPLDRATSEMITARLRADDTERPCATS
jgi:ATP/ADP translocase